MPDKNKIDIVAEGYTVITISTDRYEKLVRAEAKLKIIDTMVNTLDSYSWEKVIKAILDEKGGADDGIK